MNAKILRYTVAIPAFILALSLPGLFILARYADLPLLQSVFIPMAAFSLSVFSLGCLYFLYHNQLLRATNSLAVGILMTILIGGFAFPGLNQYIGFREICRKATTIAQAQGIKNFYFYRFRSGQNMDCLLKTEIHPIEPADIVSLSGKQNFILFIKANDLKKKMELGEFTKYMQRYNIGNYCIIIFKQN